MEPQHKAKRNNRVQERIIIRHGFACVAMHHQGFFKNKTESKNVYIFLHIFSLIPRKIWSLYNVGCTGETPTL